MVVDCIDTDLERAIDRDIVHLRLYTDYVLMDLELLTPAFDDEVGVLAGLGKVRLLVLE